MGTTHFCDVCGKTGSMHKVVYLCHIPKMVEVEHTDGCRLAGFYVDSESNPISGREESVDLCVRCYNAVMCEMVRKIEEMKKSLGPTDRALKSTWTQEQDPPVPKSLKVAKA